jgi:hypothetical protein
MYRRRHRPAQHLLPFIVILFLAAAAAARARESPAEVFKGRVRVWDAVDEVDPLRAFLHVQDGGETLRLVGWEPHGEAAGKAFGTSSVVEVTGRRTRGPAVDLLHVESIRLLQPRPHPPHKQQPKASTHPHDTMRNSMGGSNTSMGRRRLGQDLANEDECAECGKVEVAQNLKILVVRPRLPANCAGNLQTLQGGCDKPAWQATLFGTPGVASSLSECTWGALGYDQPAFVVTNYVSIGCTPLQGSGRGYCGDEWAKWQGDAGAWEWRPSTLKP